MPLERYKLFRSSLRFRLMAWNTVVMFLLSLAALLAVREGLRLTLLAELDERLREDALEVSLAVKQFYPRLEEIRQEMDRKAIGHELQHMFVQLADDNGKILVSSVQMPRAPLPALARDYRPPETRHGYRLVQASCDRPGAAPMWVRVGCSVAAIQQDVAKLTRLILVVGLALLPMATFGGYLLAHRAIKPLAQIIRTARRLRPARLDERLPLRHTGDELDQLSLTINHLLDRIAEYLSRHREFVANAAHELRSPLAAIQSSVEVGLNADRSAEEYRELLYETVEQCRHLGILVNQLLLLAESDAKPLTERDRLRFDQVVAKAVDMFRAAAEERGLTLRIEHLSAIEIWGSAARLRQVVNNLIDNALKFTPSGGEVKVRLDAVPSEQRVTLRVSDTGIGIPPTELPHIFERFYQVDKSRQRETHTRGNGLGLSICKAIVAAHGGRIEAQSRPGAGTVFIITLPLVKEPGDIVETDPDEIVDQAALSA